MRALQEYNMKLVGNILPMHVAEHFLKTQMRKDEVENYAFQNLLLPAATKLGQGNVFTGVCDSVHRGVSATVHAGIPHTPWSRHPPDTPPEPTPSPTPRKQTTAYGQRAASTHPTGVHSCDIRASSAGVRLKCIKEGATWRLLYHALNCQSSKLDEPLTNVLS